ncbi:MAG: hypothetical protein ACI4FY_03670 [Acetatifactor sp.]
MSREYKSDVFSMLMENKTYALEVYNALNYTNYADPDMVEVVELDKGVSLSIRNDASFIVDMNFNFYEHQSTYNPNMPLRSLIYMVNTLEDWLKKNEKDLFSRKLIRIPTPHFVTFYNGTETRPEYEEMRLSQAFCRSTDRPELEVICSVYNINPPYNEDLKSRSEVLWGYTCFVERVRSYQRQGKKVGEAVETAIDECIREHILEDFFLARKDEVMKVTHLDYTWEKREKMIYRDGVEEGVAYGLSRVAANMLLQNKPEEEIVLLTGLSLEDIRELRKTMAGG